MAKGHRRVYIARIRGANDSWNSSLVMLSGRDSASRTPTTLLPRSARHFLFAGEAQPMNWEFLGTIYDIRNMKTKYRKELRE